MKDFTAEAYDEITQQWVDVASIEFRSWNDFPFNGINQIMILGKDGVEARGEENIREIRFKDCY